MSHAFFEVVGIAQDGGHPHPGCTRACCAAAWNDPRLAHLPASAVVGEADRRWLIDATPALPAQLYAAGGTLEGVLLTHAHLGHYPGLLYLGREAMNTQGVELFAMPRMLDLLMSNQPSGLVHPVS